MMATRSGLVKKTALESLQPAACESGIIAIKLREDDELVDVVITKTGDEVVLATARGMAIRFSEADARPMGRNTSGVKGISLGDDDRVVGMVVADPDATLLTACATATASARRSARTARWPKATANIASDADGEPADDTEPAAGGDAEAATEGAEDGEVASSPIATARSAAAARACATSRPPSATAR